MAAALMMRISSWWSPARPWEPQHRRRPNFAAQAWKLEQVDLRQLFATPRPALSIG